LEQTAAQKEERRALLGLIALTATLVLPLAAAEPAAKPDYAAVEAVFAKHCLDCHGAQDAEKGLVLESFEALAKGGETGAAFVPGKSAESLLVKFLEGRAGKEGKNQFMPPGKRKRLEPAELALVKAWIDSGAVAPKDPSKVIAREMVFPKVIPTVAPRRAIHAIAHAPGPKLIAVAFFGEVELRSADSHALIHRLTGQQGHVNSLAFSADGRQLASAAGEPGRFGEVRLWNVADGKLIRTFTGHKDALYAVAISPDGTILASGSYDQKIKLWNVATGEELRTLSAHNGAVFSLAFRADGKVLASASGDRTVKLWEVATGKRLDTLSQSLKELYAVAFSPDGQRLYAGGVDSRIREWQISATAAEGTNPILESRFAHEGPILNLVFSSDGRTLLSSAEDRTVKLWNARTLTERLSLEAQPDQVPALAFTADNQTVVVGRLDGTLGYYDATSGKTIKAAARP
jgi:mono/diheme cytochrome c family protein/dipeptidyl aminopeptidase/acylaminoacyl peptidase